MKGSSFRCLFAIPPLAIFRKFPAVKMSDFPIPSFWQCLFHQTWHDSAPLLAAMFSVAEEPPPAPAPLNEVLIGEEDTFLRGGFRGGIAGCTERGNKRMKYEKERERKTERERKHLFWKESFIARHNVIRRIFVGSSGACFSFMSWKFTLFWAPVLGDSFEMVQSRTFLAPCKWGLGKEVLLCCTVSPLFWGENTTACIRSRFFAHFWRHCYLNKFLWSISFWEMLFFPGSFKPCWHELITSLLELKSQLIGGIIWQESTFAVYMS